MIKISFISVMIIGLCLFFSSCLTTSEASAVPVAEGESTPQEVVQESSEIAEELPPPPPPPPPLPNLSVKAGKTPPQIRLGQSFSSAFTATVLDKDTGNPVEGITVTLQYPSSSVNDKVTFATVELTTNTQGEVSFSPADTSFTCNSAVTFSVESRNGTEKTTIPYQVRTNRHNKGGSISILDYSQNGTPIRDNSRSASALLTALIRSGFSNVGLVDFVNEIHSGDKDRVYKAAYNLIGNNSNFFIFGTVKYNGEITQENGEYLVPLIGEITCLEMRTGEELYHTVIEVVGKGSSEWAALQNARMDLFGPQASAGIMYGM